MYGIVVCDLLFRSVDVDDEGEDRHASDVDCVYEGEVFEAPGRQALREFSDGDPSIGHIRVDQ